MKHKTSVSFDDETIYYIRELIRTGSFRNKSHVVEYAIQELIKKVRLRNG